MTATTTLVRCSINELVAIERACKGERQLQVVLGNAPWTRRDYLLLERLRDLRGVLVIEDHVTVPMHVTIAGTVRPDGFTKKF